MRHFVRMAKRKYYKTVVERVKTRSDALHLICSRNESSQH